MKNEGVRGNTYVKWVVGETVLNLAAPWLLDIICIGTRNNNSHLYHYLHSWGMLNIKHVTITFHFMKTLIIINIYMDKYFWQKKKMAHWQEKRKGIGVVMEMWCVRGLGEGRESKTQWGGESFTRSNTRQRHHHPGRTTPPPWLSMILSFTPTIPRRRRYVVARMRGFGV